MVLPLTAIPLMIDLSPFIKISSHNNMCLHGSSSLVQTTLLSNFEDLLQENNVMHLYTIEGRCHIDALPIQIKNVYKQHKPACKSHCIPGIFENIINNLKI